jgi:hypothetical protein
MNWNVTIIGSPALETVHMDRQPWQLRTDALRFRRLVPATAALLTVLRGLFDSRSQRSVSLDRTSLSPVFLCPSSCLRLHHLTYQGKGGHNANTNSIIIHSDQVQRESAQA